jgi:hypothetical protein
MNADSWGLIEKTSGKRFIRLAIAGEVGRFYPFLPNAFN